MMRVDPAKLFQEAMQLHQAQRLGDGERVYRQILALDPNYAPALHFLGILVAQTGRVEEGVGLMRRGLTIAPKRPTGWCDLGRVLAARRDFDGVIEAAGTALSMQTDSTDALMQLANAHIVKGQFAKAEEAARRVMEISPDMPGAHFALATAYFRQGRLDEAKDVLEARIARGMGGGNAPAAIQRLDVAQVYNAMGTLLKDLACGDEAVGMYKKAVELNPQSNHAHSNLVYSWIFTTTQSVAENLEELKRYNRQHVLPLVKEIVPLTNERDLDAGSGGRKLRIGYVSPDFKKHCQSLFTVPLLRNHERGRFEIYCYASVGQPDEVTDKIKGYAEVWRNVDGVNHKQVAEIIRKDRIDVLVDLTMHMERNRLPVFARRAAPVQMCWLAYPGSTGLSTMDYRVSDPHLDPLEYERYWTERTLRLPASFWCYDPMVTEAIEPGPLPAKASGYVTFGCLNSFAKLHDGLLEVWGRVLKAVEGSRMIILAPETKRREWVVEKLGINRERIEFVGFQPRDKYLKTYQRIDVCLDTFPCNGHTTSLDAYWMGVPVVSVVGKTPIARAGVSQLTNLGLTELLAENVDFFVGKAAGLATDLGRLADLRATLRGRMEGSPLMDGEAFARGMEGLYIEAWRRWCVPDSEDEDDDGAD